VSIEVRLLTAADRGVLDRVAEGVFDEAIDPRWAAEFFADPRHHLIVALEEGIVVGFVSAVDYVHPDKPTELFINEVGVAPSHQRRGIARRLLDAMLTHGRALGHRGGQRRRATALRERRRGGGAVRAVHVHAGRRRERRLSAPDRPRCDAPGRPRIMRVAHGATPFPSPH
jgi:GNAT superfamily N-acetyltransferase